MSCRIVSLEEATKIYDRLDPILKVPSLSPEFVFADSFKRREYQPIFWLYQKKNDVILRSFQIVETRLSDNLVVKDIESAYGYGGVLASNNDKEFLRLTPDELRSFDGSNENKLLLMAVDGKILNLEKGKHFYGKGKTYSIFAGRVRYFYNVYYLQII